MYVTFDWTMFLLLIAAVISGFAQAKVQSAFRTYDRVPAKKGITAAEAAREILRSSGINDVSIQHTGGTLTDAYAPKKKTIFLSDSTYSSGSIAAIGVAAHECGHAIQHANAYAPLMLSNAVQPACVISSKLGTAILIMGFISSLKPLLTFGLILFGIGIVVAFITLPIEYNASDRAMEMLASTNMMDQEEIKGVKKVLRAAGLTYVAAAASSVLSLLRMVFLVKERNGRGSR